VMRSCPGRSSQCRCRGERAAHTQRVSS
jgi:hypothetical protein